MVSATPLAGITVVELGHSVAAPFAGSILGQLGATVVKVENPLKGDHTRDWGPPYRDDTAVIFDAFNRDKHGVTADLREQGDVSRLKRFIEQRADVFIQNLRPGTAQKLGFGDADLTARNPRLIYCSLSAFGAAGPLRDSPGYDPLMQAYGGLMSVTGENGRPPVRVGASIIDMGTGMWSAIAILAALFERERTGRGGTVQTSLYETAISLMGAHIATYLADRQVPGRHGSAAGFIVPHQIFETANGHLMVAAGNDGLFRKLCVALDRPQLAEDPRFATNGIRVANRESLVPMLTDIFKSAETAVWRRKLDAASVPNAPLQNIGEVIADEQTRLLGLLQDSPGANGSLSLIGLPLSFDGVRPPFRRPPPKLGEHQFLLDSGQKP